MGQKNPHRVAGIMDRCRAIPITTSDDFLRLLPRRRGEAVGMSFKLMDE